MAVDDWSDWLDEVDDVTPLKGKKQAQKPEPQSEAPKEEPDQAEEPLQDTSDAVTQESPALRLFRAFQSKKNKQPEGMHHQDISRADHMSATRASVDEKTRRRLMKGNFAIDARLDLHGMTVEQARIRTENILARCAHSGARVLLLVHGKGVGHGEKGNMGAIKSQVTDWLIASPHVLAFHSAKPKHGGVGALYVLIRRTRG